jgi:SAM-dependent methyltransferase
MPRRCTLLCALSRGYSERVTDQEWRRRSFNERAEEYRLARPPYPARVYQLLSERCGLGPGTQVVEIGGGTGQATCELLARGAHVVAVEPGAALAAHLSATLSGPALRIVHDEFETADLPWAAFDLATSATAFHWVRPDVALPKLARILRPGGWLAVWWTVFGDPERPTSFRAALDELYARYLPEEPRGIGHVPGPLKTASWSAELSQGGWFGPVEVELIRWEYQLTGAGARRLFGSFPNVNELPAPERTALLDAIADIVYSRFGGIVADPYVTALYLAPSR